MMLPLAVSSGQEQFVIRTKGKDVQKAHRPASLPFSLNTPP
jgi:hypothetical protein